MSKPRARRATACPIRPDADNARASCRSPPAPARWFDCEPGNTPERTTLSPSTIRRAHGEQQPEGEIGGGIGHHRRNVGDDDLAHGRLVHIDTVGRDRHRGDRLQGRIGGQHLAIDGVVQQTQKDVGALGRVDQLGFGRIRLESSLSSTSAISFRRISALSAIGWVT